MVRDWAGLRRPILDVMIRLRVMGDWFPGRISP